MSLIDFFKKGQKKENCPKSGDDVERQCQTVEGSAEYELDDITYIREMKHTMAGAWQQYDVLLAARGYGWEDMKAWADYMSKNDLDISHGTLTVAEITGAEEKEIIDQYQSIGSILQIPAFDTEQGVLAMGGASQKLHAPVKIYWMNQTNYLQFFTLISDETLMRRYIETVIRRSFGTPDEMKLAKPIPVGK